MNESQTKINVLGHEYTIDEIDSARVSDVHMGRVDIRKCKISINNNMPLCQKQRTVLHELIHVYSEEFGLGLSEEQVDCLAVGLTNTDIIKLDYKG